tara:strand:+ start:62 stop:694 length:633 start_codon:yes stop_codon:yes gene_type:complete
MTTWVHSSSQSDISNPRWIVSNLIPYNADSGDDLIAPYGDFNEDMDITKFWDTSLSSVTGTDLASVAIDSGTLKITGDSSSSNKKLIKAIPVVIGRSYTVSGDTTAGSDDTLIIGGSTSYGNDYFSILATAFPDDWEDDVTALSLTFTATTSTFYLSFATSSGVSYFMSFDNISLIQNTVISRPSWKIEWDSLKWHMWKNETSDNWEDWG